MSFLVRKIAYNKWKDSVENDATPSADAITGCTRTTDNTLSVWLIDDLAELDEAVLAIASDFKQPVSIDIVPIDLSLLQKKALVIKDTLAPTAYVDFQANHRDIADLDYTSLGSVAEVIIDAIKQRLKSVETTRITAGQLKKILKKGVDDGKIQREALKPSMQQKLFPEASV